MLTPISGSTPNPTSLLSRLRDTTLWSHQDRFEDAKISGKAKQNNRPTNRSIKNCSGIFSANTKQNSKIKNTDIIDPHTRFLREPILEELMNNSKYRYYSDCLETRKIFNSGNLEDIIFSLERSRLFAKTFLKFSSFELFKNSTIKEENKYSETQLLSIYGINITKMITRFLSDSFFTSIGIPIEGLSNEGSKYLKETFVKFFSHNSLINFLKSNNNPKDFGNTVYFIAVIIASLWTKSGNHESHTYLIAFRQALCCDEKDTIFVKYHSNLFSSVVQGDGITVPCATGPAVYIKDVNNDYNKKYKDENNLDFIVTVEMAKVCYEMIEDIHNVLNTIFFVKSTETQNTSKETLLHDENFLSSEGFYSEGAILYHWNKFQKAIRDAEEKGVKKIENLNLPSVFNKNAYDTYQAWLKAKEEDDKFIEQARNFE